MTEITVLVKVTMNQLQIDWITLQSIFDNIVIKNQILETV
jgi:hypothetical protein